MHGDLRGKRHNVPGSRQFGKLNYPRIHSSRATHQPPIAGEKHQSTQSSLPPSAKSKLTGVKTFWLLIEAAVLRPGDENRVQTDNVRQPRSHR